MRIFVSKEMRGQLQACMRTWPPQDGISMEELLHPPLCLCLLSAIRYSQWKNCRAGRQLPHIWFSVPLDTTHPSRYGRDGIIKLFELQRILEIYVLYITQASPRPPQPTPMKKLSHLCQDMSSSRQKLDPHVTILLRLVFLFSSGFSNHYQY